MRLALETDIDSVASILVVEDEADIQELIAYNL